MKRRITLRPLLRIMKTESFPSGKTSDLLDHRMLNYVFWGAFSPYVILCFFNNPSYDDFTYTVSTFGKTFWESQVYWYTHWSGRYTATALLTINPLTNNWIYGYKLLSLGIILNLLITIHFLVNTYLGQLTGSVRWFLTSLFVAFYFSLLPHLSGGIYWMAGSLTHAVPTILAGLCVALFKKKGRSRLLDYIILPLMTFLIVGSNETIMCIWIALLLMVNINVLRRNKKVDPVFVLLFIVGVAGSLIVIFAPGNMVRGSTFHNSHRPLHAFSNALVYAFVYMFKFGSIPFGFFLVWTAKNAKKIQEKLQWNWINKQSLIQTFVVFCVVQFCTFFPALWAMGGRPPKYVYNMTILFYVPLSLLTLLQLAVIFPEKFRFLDRLNLNSKKMVVVFVIIFMLMGNNGRAIYDTLWDARKYNAQLNSRYNKIANSGGQDVVVDDLMNKPRSIFYSDIENEPQDFKNQQYAKYFHLKSISKRISHE